MICSTEKIVLPRQYLDEGKHNDKTQGHLINAALVGYHCKIQKNKELWVVNPHERSPGQGRKCAAERETLLRRLRLSAEWLVNEKDQLRKKS